MNVSRVTVFNALFSLLQAYITTNYQDYTGVPQFQTFSKAYRTYAKVPSQQQPAMFLVAGPEMPDQDTTPGITRWELIFYAIFFLSIDPLAENPSAAEILLATVDMVDDALFNNSRPQDLASQNLGVPLVYNTWLDRRNGKIEIRQPILVPQAAIVIPISVITGTQFNGMRS